MSRAPRSSRRHRRRCLALARRAAGRTTRGSSWSSARSPATRPAPWPRPTRSLAEPPDGVAAAELAYVRGRLLDRLGRPAPPPPRSPAPWAGERPGALRAAAPGRAPGRDRPSRGGGRAGRDAPRRRAAARARSRPRPGCCAARSPRGGDCRLLGGLELRGLPARERRQLELARADCELRARPRGRRRGAPARPARGEPGRRRRARRRGAPRGARRRRPPTGASSACWGSPCTATASSTAPPRIWSRPRRGCRGHVPSPRYELRYALRRGHFWQGRYRAAATGFGGLARQARSRAAGRRPLPGGPLAELIGDWSAAAAASARAFLAHPRGEDCAAGAVRGAAARVARRPREPALEAYRVLGSRPAFRATAARAALFLAASDLVRGRARPRRGPGSPQPTPRGAPREEAAYWRGRLSELEGRAPSAVLRLRRGAARRPLSSAGARRAAPSAPRRRSPDRRAPRACVSPRPAPRDLYAAWLLLGDGIRRVARREALAALLARRPPRRARSCARRGAGGGWPLWSGRSPAPRRAAGAGPARRRRARGARRTFRPASRAWPSPAARLLAAAGETRRALLIAEVLAERAPERVPLAPAPRDYRRLLYPLPYRDRVRAQAAAPASIRTCSPRSCARRAASIRGRSRPAAARGLAQFVLPTARRLAAAARSGATHRRRSRAAGGLDRPRRRLPRRARPAHPRRAPQAVAAYNAGEAQAALWRSYCFTEPEEYLTKVPSGRPAAT